MPKETFRPHVSLALSPFHYVRLHTEVVISGWSDLRDDVYEVGAIRQVSMVEPELVPP